MYKTYSFLKKHLTTIYGWWASFFSATILGNLNNTLQNTIRAVLAWDNMANVIFICWTCALAILTIVYFVLKKIILKTAPSRVFLRIMNCKTAEMQKGQIEFSWGYNKNIHRCKNPEGWLPSAFWISHYDPVRYFSFPRQDKEGLRGYNVTTFDAFCQTDRIQDCRKNQNDMDRFAVCTISPNFNDKDKRIQIELQKTKWSALQFHWEYMRLFC